MGGHVRDWANQMHMRAGTRSAIGDWLVWHRVHGHNALQTLLESCDRWDESYRDTTTTDLTLLHFANAVLEGAFVVHVRPNWGCNSIWEKRRNAQICFWRKKSKLTAWGYEDICWGNLWWEWTRTKINCEPQDIGLSRSKMWIFVKRLSQRTFVICVRFL